MRLNQIIAQLQAIQKKEGNIEGVIEIYDDEEEEYKIVPMNDLSLEERKGFKGNTVGFLV